MSGAAISVAIYSLTVINSSDITDVSIRDIVSVIQQSDTADPRKRILILNIVTVVIGIIMWILIALSLILKWKHSMFFAVMVSVEYLGIYLSLLDL